MRPTRLLFLALLRPLLVSTARLLFIHQNFPAQWLPLVQARNREGVHELLLGNGDAFFELSGKLPKCPDLEYIVASCLVQIPKYGTQCGSADKCQTLITKILALKKAVCKVEELHGALASLDDKAVSNVSTQKCRHLKG